MEELYFIPSVKISARVAELVIEGEHIEIGGLTYQRLSRKPRGRSVSRKLRNESTNTRIIIY